MKKRLSISALGINFILAFVFATLVNFIIPVNPFLLTVAIVAIFAVVTYFTTNSKGVLQIGLQTEVWTSDIIEQPVPDNSFILASQDLSEWVDHNTINLVEAGVEPAVFEDYFNGNENPLPLANIKDIPHSVVLHTYSTEQTRHRGLQDIELQYDKKASIIKRHKVALDKNMGVRAAFAWTPAQNNAFNKLMQLTDNDSIIDAMIDMESFFGDNDFTDGLHVCFNNKHFARIKKEDKKLYKEILNEGQMFNFKVHRYSKTPLFTADGVKKPMGATADPTDKRATFFWSENETFRCFGDVEMYANLRDSAYQADTLSFAQRALIGAMRANNPKYFGGII